MFSLLPLALLPLALFGAAEAAAQDGATPREMPPQDVVRFDADEIASLTEPAEDDQDAEEAAARPTGIDLLTLITRGGRFMIPIGIMSLLVVTFAVERMVSLRHHKLIPRPLAARLSSLLQPAEHFDPEAAYAACRQYPSAASRVVAAMLLRTGRPMGEIEQAARETAQREADTYAGPIRWLILAAAVTPLMGLLGTVWGMIIAFHNSATMTVERSRSEQLSEGIYTALVTTLAGLAVAIPAAILALYLENRLSRLFHRIEEVAFSVAPGLERFTGRQRLDASGRLRPLGHAAPPPAPGRAAASTGAPPTAEAEIAKRKRTEGREGEIQPSTEVLR